MTQRKVGLCLRGPGGFLEEVRETVPKVLLKNWRKSLPQRKPVE